MQRLVAQIGRYRNLDFSQHRYYNVSMISTLPKHVDEIGKLRHVTRTCLRHIHVGHAGIRGRKLVEQSGIIDPHGGFRKLKSYQSAEIVYDATVVFCNRLIDRRSRTHDQMVQAARSGKQNIAEGSVASGTSKKTELKLVGVARASLEELLLDYQDFLRQRGLPLWGKDHPQAQAIRKLAYVQNRSYATYKTYVEGRFPRNCRQHPDLPDPPGQLPARPAAPAVGAAVFERRRVYGKALSGAAGGKEKAMIKNTLGEICGQRGGLIQTGPFGS